MKLSKAPPSRFSKSATPAFIALPFEDFLALTDVTTLPATTTEKFPIRGRGRNFPDRTEVFIRVPTKR